MAIVDMKRIMQLAKESQYAIGSFNVFNFETLSAVVSVAEELKAPVVIGLSERLFRFADVDGLAVAMVRTAHRSSASIAVQLDHGRTYEGVMKAIRWGFNSVMFDGSHLSIEENTKRAKEISRMTRAAGVALEAELDCSNFDGGNSNFDIKIGEDFASKTKLDVLAICYNRSNVSSKQDCDIMKDLANIKTLSNIIKKPISLHINAKQSKHDYKQIINSGICKINIPTEMSIAAVDSLKKELAVKPNINLVNLMAVVRKGVKDMARKYMLCFDCISQDRK